MKIDYQKLTEKYLTIAKQVVEELKATEKLIGCAALGSTARRDVHSLSDIDLLVLIEGSGVYHWKRRTVQDIVVNIAIRSPDVLERLIREHPDTIFGLKDALILYDPENLLQSFKKDAIITKPLEEELLGDLLDEARSFIGKAERALVESSLESSVLCLRQGAIKLVELLFYSEKGSKINHMYFWEETETLSSPTNFKELFTKIQKFELVEKQQTIEMLKRLKTFLPEPRK